MSDPTLLVISGVVLTVWVFAVGASFGSFLNVIAWRMPLGMPLMIARSHCPKCQFKIPPKDNLPIVGWLHLRGMCRNCRESISGRYPLVETLIATFFAVLFITEVVAHGVHLPGWYDSHHGNWLMDLFRCELLWVFVRHCMLVYFLMAIALIDFDRNPVPFRLTLSGVACCLFYSQLLPTSIPTIEESNRFLDPRIEAVTFVALGLIAGCVTGFAFSAISARASDRWWQNPNFSAFALLGVYCGWGVVASVVWLSIILHVASTVLSRMFFTSESTDETEGEKATKARTIPSSWPTIAAIIIQIFVWRWLDLAMRTVGWINTEGRPELSLFIVGLVGVAIVGMWSLVGGSFHKRDVTPSAPSPDG